MFSDLIALYDAQCSSADSSYSDPWHRSDPTHSDYLEHTDGVKYYVEHTDYFDEEVFFKIHY